MNNELQQRCRGINLVVFDFDGVFTDNRVLTLEDGREAVFCSRADGFGLAAAREVGLKLLVLSKEVNPVVGARCRKLGIESIQGCDDKAHRLRQEVESHGITLAETAYLGNDINDIPCLELVGLPACVADSWPEVFPHCHYVTERRGGEGAVREFCELLVTARRQGLRRE